MTSVHNSEFSDEQEYIHPYERELWFKEDESRTRFEMTRNFLTHFILDIKLTLPKSFIEVNSGTGMWTSVFTNAWNMTSFDLLEERYEMNALAKSRFRNNSLVKIYSTDFLQYAPGKTHDFFFAHSIFEKDAYTAKIFQHMHILMNWGGEGLIIAQTPHFANNPVESRVPEKSSQGIESVDLVRLLTNAGMKILDIYPVTFFDPWVKHAWARPIFFFVLRRVTYNRLVAFFTVSYAVYFKKV